MAPRTFWIVCALLGMATIIVALAIFPMFPSDSASDVSGYGGVVYAFEFARVPKDLTDIFGLVDDPDRARRITMMDAGNRWDFLFMTVYGLFGVFFGVAAMRSVSKIWAWIAILAVIASVADLIETGTLLSLTEEMADGGTLFPSLHYLWIPVTIKFAALAASVMGAGLFIATRRGIVWNVLGALTVLASVLVIPGLIVPSAYGGLLGPAVGVGWIVMLAYAISVAIRRPTQLAGSPR
jgi:hypothetical protein